MPRTPNSPKYARSLRTCAEFRLKRSARSCEDTVFTPSSSSWRRQRVYTESRRTVISGILGRRDLARRGIAGDAGAARPGDANTGPGARIIDRDTAFLLAAW